MASKERDGALLRIVSGRIMRLQKVVSANVHVPSTVAGRTALQLFLCVSLGMINMIAYERQCLPRDGEHWAGWPTCGWPPKASFQLITYVFLAEASVGSVASKSVLRIYGTVSGAVMGSVIILISAQCPNGIGRDVLITTLTGLTLAGLQYCKSKKPAYAYMMVMSKLTVILVLVWGWDKDELDTSFETPYWRVLQVVIGCVLYNTCVRLFVPNFDRLKVRREVSKLAASAADAYEVCAAHFVSERGEPPTMQDLLELQSAISAQLTTAKNGNMERWFYGDKQLRNPKSEMAGFVVIINALSRCAACMQAVRMPFDDEAFSTPELLLEANIRDGVEEMSQHFVQALRTLSLMLGKPNITYTNAVSMIRREVECYTHSTYLGFMQSFDDSIQKCIDVGERTRKEVLTYVNDVALTENDVLNMLKELQEKKVAGKNLDADGDGDFDLDDTCPAILNE